MTSMLLNYLIPKVVLGFRSLDIPIHFVLKLSEPSPTTLPLESTDYDFSLTWTSRVHVTIILLKQEDIFYMSVEDLVGTGILEEIC